MTSPFENTIYNFTSPQNILRDHLRSSLLAYQTQSMLGRFNGGSGSFRRPRPRSPPKDSLKILDTYTHAPPTYPSYLEDTIYALLVEEQYKHFCRKYGIVNRSSNNNNNNNNRIRRSKPLTNITSQFDISSSHTSNRNNTFANTATTTTHTSSTNTRRNNRHGTHVPDDPSGSSSSSSSASSFSSTARPVIFEEVDTVDKAASPESSTTDGSHLSCASSLPFSTLGSSSSSSSRYNSYLARLEYQDLRLPTAWSPTERGPNLDLGENDNEIIYKGIIEGDVSSVRSNYWVKPQCGLFYYEVKIEASDENSDGHISIGFCDEYSRLDRLPGSDEYSWGYHGENGYLTGGRRPSSNNNTRKYGACFGIGDTIGCGIDFSDKTIFYTRNGIHLGTAFRDVSGKRIYPTIGFKATGEKVTANFGGGHQHSPFIFDIDQYRKGVADRVVHHIMASTPSPSSSSNPLDDHQQQKRPRKKSTTLVDHLVVNYLNHVGYMDTFAAMKKEMANGMDEQDLATCEKVKIRQDICMALRNGQIDQVFIKCEQHYPDMLQGYPRILFRLQCQKFMALVASVMPEQQQEQEQQPSSSTLEKTAMHFEKQQQQQQQQVGDKRTRSILEMDDGGVDDEDDGYDWRDLQTVMDYGQYLQQTYGSSSCCNGVTITTPSEKSIRQIMECDPKEGDDGGVKDSLADIDVTSELKATFSILAYIQPSDNPNAYLCGPKWREGIASELNAAMLVTEGEHPESSLERLYRQTSVTMHELVLNGNGQASMVPIVDSLL